MQTIVLVELIQHVVQNITTSGNVEQIKNLSQLCPSFIGAKNIRTWLSYINILAILLHFHQMFIINWSPGFFWTVFH